ncbi:hypothetical protein JYU16_00645 [bacterium AH-315-M05]|nr:hypothetical protein [bacterium AH-315-M05]
MKLSQLQYLLPIFLLLSNINSYCQWVEKANGNVPYLTSVFFLNADTGLAVGGSILRTFDGGETWDTVYSIGGLNSIHFPTINTGYVVGGYNTVLKTSDIGDTWQIQNIPINDPIVFLFSVHFSDSLTGYIAGGRYDPFTSTEIGFVLRTIDGGNNWTYSYNTFIQMNDVYAIKNSNIVYAVGGYNTPFGDIYKLIIKSIDNGVSWSEINSPFDVPLRNVYFLDSLSGFISGFGEFMKTNDGGNTFDTITIYDSPPSYYINSLYFNDIDTGYMVGSNGTIIKTINGGVSWGKQNINTTENLYSVFFIDKDIGFIVGSKGSPWDGVIFKTTNGGGPITGLENQFYNEFELEFNLFSNLVNDVLIISFSRKIQGYLNIYDIMGRKVYNQNITNENKIKIDIQKLHKALYIIQFIDMENKSYFVSKFLKIF